MRITIVHNAVGAAGSPDERDVLVQAAAVREALEALGHHAALLPCTLDLADLRRRLLAQGPALVFNLVESLESRGSLIFLVPALLDAMGVAYTGAGTEAMRVTSHKGLAKDRMAALGLPTPAWIGPVPADVPRLSPETPPSGRPSDRWIIKSLWEHASIGLDEAATVLCAPGEDLWARMRARAPQLGGACFAERFIEGREFNLSLLGGPEGPRVLPPAEIRFEGYPPGALRIVGYRAKWDASSYEFHHTPRRFDFPPEDRPLLDRLADLALRCWRGFGLRGYARVDFRVDEGGRPWILEINANPCLSPDGGFAAALQAAGIRFADAVARIVADTPPRPAA